MKDNLVVAITPSAEQVAIIGGRNDPARVIVISWRNGNSTIQAKKTTDSFALIPSESKILATKLWSSYTSTRDSTRYELSEEEKSRQVHEFLQYMESTFGNRLRDEAEETLDFIFRAMRRLDKRNLSGWSFGKTQAATALELAAFIEELVETGFTQKAAEGWYDATSCFGSYRYNIDRFIERSKKPLAAAELTHFMFKKIRNAKAEVQQMLKQQIKAVLDKLSKSSN